MRAGLNCGCGFHTIQKKTAQKQHSKETQKTPHLTAFNCLSMRYTF